MARANRNTAQAEATENTENTDVTNTDTTGATTTDNGGEGGAKAKRVPTDLSAVKVTGASTRRIVNAPRLKNPDDPISRAVRNAPVFDRETAPEGSEPQWQDLTVPDDATIIKATIDKVRSVAQRADIGVSISPDTPFRGTDEYPVPEGHAIVSFYTRPKQAKATPDRGGSDAQTDTPTEAEAAEHNENVNFPTDETV